MKPATYAPVYAALYPLLAEVSRSHGYALAVHGSLSRDLDAVCIPWVERPSEPQAVVDEVLKRFHVRQIEGPVQKLHGRIVYTISIGHGECAVDWSFMPVLDDEGDCWPSLLSRP